MGCISVIKTPKDAKFYFNGYEYSVTEVTTDSLGNIEIIGHILIPTISGPIGTTGSCVVYPAKQKEKPKFDIKKIQVNPKKNATTVIFENGHVEVVKKNDLDPEADLYSVVAYAVAKYVYGSNSAFKREIRNCIFESLEVK